MKSERLKEYSSDVVDFLKDLVIILIIVKIFITFFAMNFQIKGQSMYDSYYDKEFIIVDRLSYRFSEPSRGDVVVFRPHVSEDKEYFLKRIIGIPGDTIKIDNGNVFLKKQGEADFSELDEPYLSNLNAGFTFINGDKDKSEYKVPADSYFVMGDNRNHSTDSRTCFSSCSLVGASNFASEDNLIGRVWIDLGYFNFKNFSFIHPSLGIETKPRFFNSPSSYSY